MPTAGWPLVGYIAACVAALTGGILWMLGAGEEGLRASARATARISALLFLLPFLASPLRRAYAHPATEWLVANRRHLGVSFAASQAIHLMTVVAFTVLTGTRPDATTLVAGGIGYGLIAAMTATSFDRTAAWLGPVRWRRLHVTGVYYLWAIFVFTFAGSREWTGRIVLAALLVALPARLWIARRGEKGRQGAVP